MTTDDLQYNEHGKLRHFLTLENLSKDTLEQILNTAEGFIDFGQRQIKKAPLLRGKTVVNLFFEPSTRTRTTFEIAAKRLSADVINLNATRLSTNKGETVLDTVRNLEAMHTDLFIVRDSQSGAAYLIAQHVPDHVSIINAGDGRHSHPTQAMLDVFTIRQHRPDFENLSVAIVGDILHSRVARSQIHALNIMGVPDVRVIAPNTLLPTEIERLGVRAYTNMTQGLEDTDVVIMLRLQMERMQGSLVASEQEYFNLYGLTLDKLKVAKSDVMVMHPGPMNRGLEISSEVADGEQSVILSQVTNGIAVRMSVMSILMGGKEG